MSLSNVDSIVISNAFTPNNRDAWAKTTASHIFENFKLSVTTLPKLKII